MDWHEIYQRLQADSEDAQAWQALSGRARAWLRATLRGDERWLDDAAADVCADVDVAANDISPRWISRVSTSRVRSTLRPLIRTMLRA